MRRFIGAALAAGLLCGTGMANAQSGPPPSGPGGVRSATTPSKWVRMISRKGGVTALVPSSEPVKRSLVTQDTPGGPLKLITLSVQEGSFRHFIVYYDYPREVEAEKNATTILDFSMHTLADRAYKGKLTDVRDVTLEGHPGKAFRLTSGDGQSVLTFRVFIVGQRVYQFLVETGPDTASAPEIAKFLDSCALWSPKPGHFDRPSSPDEDIFYTTGDPGSGPPPPGRRR